MSILTPLLDFPPISRIRRNHGLEHATIHILSRQVPGKAMAGHSNTRGFWLLGDLETAQVESGVRQALARLRAGEHMLAIHPNCGTNFVAAGTVSGLAGALAMFGAGRRWRDKLERIPLAMSLATIALIFSRPLGFTLQEHITTSGRPGNMEIVSVTPTQRGKFKAHLILTRG